jgi:hypothetical protein
MIDPFVASSRWKMIKSSLDRIQDPILRESILENYRQRAEEDWGFCPGGKPVKKQTIQLDEYEQNLLKRIKTGKEYGVFQQNEDVMTEFKIRMKDFITKGGKFSDLPKELQNEHILKAYLDAIYEEMENCINFLEKN